MASVSCAPPFSVHVPSEVGAEERTRCKKVARLEVLTVRSEKFGRVVALRKGASEM